MSVRAIKWAFSLKLPTNTKFVLLVMAEHANDDGVCWPSQGLIVEMTGLSERAVRYAVHALRRADIIKMDGGKGQRSKIQLSLDLEEVTAEMVESLSRKESARKDNRHHMPENRHHMPTSNRHHVPNDRHHVPNDRHHVPNHRTTKNHQEPPTSSLRSDDTAHAVVGADGRDSQIALFDNPPPQAPRPQPPPDTRSLVWSLGVQAVRRLTGKSEGQSRSLIGRWLKGCRDDCAMLNAVILAAAEHRPVDPVPWIEAAIRKRMEGGQKSAFSLTPEEERAYRAAAREWARNGHEGPAPKPEDFRGKVAA
ncbi:helix-turn-helix domain-containing protein [Acidomonas methanolica]|uniref:Helix-turn-helix domain-containing protein n=1 Tax=Acidomonas methanolica NBRC 104435 TaxID=1231351 RepID=A0A023D7N3_ACIMT|nr:helix-turn-helix domain-containing protein [Acidomonas methanolica]TCS24127.1 helix-turn-helix protein [Acidomonas methanolica]GAJ29720.1 hypothetical protein Amme_076_013 [Acidomonas methanolica NBRC 104435]GBQ59493.1 hypothetical protein AA0498_2768 [Acidomonas methanolica]GEL00042.1 hypothetical protein AME01nite_25400 [Acidomonas methanolica NBRC 104435]